VNALVEVSHIEVDQQPQVLLTESQIGEQWRLVYGCNVFQCLNFHHNEILSQYVNAISEIILWPPHMTGSSTCVFTPNPDFRNSYARDTS